MVSIKRALMSLWEDTFDVVEYQEKTNDNGSTGFQEVTVLASQPCKLSFSTLNTTDQTDDEAHIVQTTKLFCDPDLAIKAGSKITVTRSGRTFDFKQSGEPGVFFSHQEIVLVPFKEWA
jgi:hypothetical protein